MVLKLSDDDANNRNRHCGKDFVENWCQVHMKQGSVALCVLSTVDSNSWHTCPTQLREPSLKGKNFLNAIDLALLLASKVFPASPSLHGTEINFF